MTGTIGRITAVVLVAAAIVSGCGATPDEPSADKPDRPPLASPPDPGPVPDDHGLDAALVDSVVASTVGIKGVACGRTSRGSGFAIADDAVATNAHVILGMDPIFVYSADGRELVGVPVAFDADADLAILKVEGGDFEPLDLGGAADQTVGMMIGWEAGPAPEVTPFRIDRPVNVRIESVASEERISRRSWLVAAEIDVGDSGAALVDADGIVVGIAFATSTKGLNSGYAVRATELEKLIADGFDPNLSVPDCDMSG